MLNIYIDGGGESDITHGHEIMRKTEKRSCCISLWCPRNRLKCSFSLPKREGIAVITMTNS